jgi:hypothetical protein
MDLCVRRPVIIRAVRAELMGPSELRIEGALSDDASWRELARHLRELHVQLAANKATALTVDVRGLRFANSSSIRLFIDMASGAQGAGYKLIFEIDSSVTWQRLNFSVLQSLAPEHVTIRDSVRTDRGVGS